MNTMKRLVKTGPRTTTLVDEPIPELRNEHDVLVRVEYCGVCMSEHFDWETDTVAAGRRFGHEPVGKIIAMGSAVEGFAIGDLVTGGDDAAGSAEYAIMNDKSIIKIPEGMEPTSAIIEPLFCIMSAVSKLRSLMPGERVAVVGCGYMACGAIGLLAAKGYDVVAVDIRRECLENAKLYGAKEVYTPDELPENYLSDTNPRVNGFPVVMEWGETAESLDLALHMTRMCGQLAIGAYHTGGKRLVDVQRLNLYALDCLSTHPRELDINIKAMHMAMKMLDEKSWNYHSVVTKVYPATKFDLAQAELTVKYGKWLKAVIDWRDVNADFEPYIIGE